MNPLDLRTPTALQINSSFWTNTTLNYSRFVEGKGGLKRTTGQQLRTLQVVILSNVRNVLVVMDTLRIEYLLLYRLDTVTRVYIK